VVISQSRAGKKNQIKTHALHSGTVRYFSNYQHKINIHIGQLLISTGTRQFSPPAVAAATAAPSKPELETQEKLTNWRSSWASNIQIQIKIKLLF
jgi:hypothetical protein